MPRVILSRPIEIPIGPSIAYVPLTQGQWALIDREDAEWLGRRNWSLSRSGRRGPYAQTAIRAERKLGMKTSQMHCFLVSPLPGYVTDHINGNGLDNRRANLRIVTQSENCINTPQRKSVSGHRGICWHRQSGLWMARVQKGGKVIAAYFDDLNKAAQWREATAERVHGKFMRRK